MNPLFDLLDGASQSSLFLVADSKGPAMRKHESRVTGVFLGTFCFLAVLSCVSAAYAQRMPVIRAEYERTSTQVNTGEVAVTERGHRVFSVDGFWSRVERFRGGDHTSEIIRPDDRDLDGHFAERFDLNHNLREAIVRLIRYGRPVGSPTPRPLEPGEMRNTERWLGYREVGSLLLSGFRIRDEGFELEMWHVAGSPIADVIEEKKTAGGTVDELRVIQVERDTVEESFFDVPAEYRIRRREPWLR